MTDYTYTVIARRTDTGETIPVEIGTGEAIHIRWYAKRPWWHRILRRIQ